MSMSSQGSSGARADAQAPRGKARMPRRAWFGTALLLFTLSTVAALRQAPREPDEIAKPLGWRWWFTPLEWNARRRLPYLPKPIGEIAVEGSTIWAVATDQTVYESRDSGTTWVEREVERDRMPEREVAEAGK